MPELVHWLLVQIAQGDKRALIITQELQGVLKQLERQLRAVERAASAEDLDNLLATISEAVGSHSTVAENCEKLAQLPAYGLPQLLRQHADAAVARSTADQVGLPHPPPWLTFCNPQ